MGIDPFSLAMMGASAVQSFTGASQQKKAAAAQARAAQQNAAMEIAELTRQQGEVNRVSGEQKSDRMRQAEADLARGRSAAAEGFGNLRREVAELGYLKGVDLGRIEANRQGQVGALEAGKQAAAQGAANAVDAAKRTAKAASQSALLNTIGAGIQIGAGAYARKQELEILKHKTDPAFSYNQTFTP